ncbi:hypothetical protein O181_056725 [Austropuccinia psidii MF-1]|uniref:Reverse transcriptase RNase H-like domain-containing protein n=1 Tax=Austropuccinia psidii MF-1 TaxID=1389203 RepID=A0A9Q3ED77_9BASI|nr:hypothetical protein [Austropuccinia psidii MF-1]
MTQKRIKAYGQIRKALTEAPLLLMPDWNRPFKLYIDACGDGLGAALHQVEISYRGTSLLRPKTNETNRSQMEFLFLVWALDKLHYYLYGIVFEVITDCNAVKSLLNVKPPNRCRLRWRMAIE